MSDQSTQGIQNAADIYALVDKTKAGWNHRANILDDMESPDMAALAVFIEELIAINTAQLKVMGLYLENLESRPDQLEKSIESVLGVSRKAADGD